MFGLELVCTIQFQMMVLELDLELKSTLSTRSLVPRI